MARATRRVVRGGLRGVTIEALVVVALFGVGAVLATVVSLLS